MPAPIIDCQCGFKISYNPPFIPSRCPRCKQSLENAREGSVPHAGDGPSFDGGMPDEILGKSDHSNFGRSTREVERHVRRNPITDAEFQEKLEKGQRGELE